MTNSPTYDKQLELAKMITGLGGDQPIPGSTLASDRFARASYYVSRLERPKTELQAVAGMFSVIRNAAQPFRAPDLGKPEASQTLWQTVSDLTNKRYVFASTTRPNVVWVELDQPQPHPTPTTTPLRTTPSPPKLSQTQAPILTSAGGQHLQRAQLTISNYLKQVKGTLNDPSIYAYSGLTKMTVRSSGACASELTQVHRP